VFSGYLGVADSLNHLVFNTILTSRRTKTINQQMKFEFFITHLWPVTCSKYKGIGIRKTDIFLNYMREHKDLDIQFFT
jgi:hypothetical protein